MFCSKCGSKFAGEFCSNCGNKKSAAKVVKKTNLPGLSLLQNKNARSKFLIASIVVFILALAGSLTSLSLLDETSKLIAKTEGEAALNKSVESELLGKLQEAEESLEWKKNFAVECIAKNYQVIGCLAGPSALPDLGEAREIVDDFKERVSRAQGRAEMFREMLLQGKEKESALKQTSSATSLVAIIAFALSLSLFLYARKEKQKASE